MNEYFLVFIMWRVLPLLLWFVYCIIELELWGQEVINIIIDLLVCKLGHLPGLRWPLAAKLLSRHWAFKLFKVLQDSKEIPCLISQLSERTHLSSVMPHHLDLRLVEVSQSWIKWLHAPQALSIRLSVIATFRAWICRFPGYCLLHEAGEAFLKVLLIKIGVHSRYLLLVGCLPLLPFFSFLP